MTSTDPVVVLIHGVPGTPRSWDGVCDALADLEPALETRRLVIPGWDQRQPVAPEALDLEGLGARLTSQFDDVQRPVVLVAFSAGAWLALQVARNNPGVSRLLLLEPMGLPALEAIGNHPDEARTVRISFAAMFDAADGGHRDAVETLFDVWYPAGTYKALPEKARAYMNACAPLATRDGRAVLDRSYDRHWFEQITVPTITTYGTAGPEIWKLFAEAITELLPHAETRPIDGGTHAVLDTHPKVVADLIRGLL